jgi:hypothetical protein
MVRGVTTNLVLRAHGPEDLLGAVPFLLGFHPRDSLVVAVVERSSISAVARVDLADAAVPGRSLQLLEPLLRQLGDGARAAIVGYGEDSDHVHDVVVRVSEELPVEPIARLAVCGGSWWDVESPEEVEVYDPAATQIAAEAAYNGISARPDRADLESLFRRPARAHTLSVATLRAAVRRLDRFTPSSAQRRLGVLLDRQLAAGEVSLTARECADLLLLLDVPAARDAFWLRLSRTTGPLLMDVWLHVARRAPADLSLGPVCAAGIAAWQGSTGALVTIALERADGLGGSHPLHDLLTQIHSQALPPSALDEIVACLAA